jgi:predicted phage terminase large subunit-like protein
VSATRVSADRFVREMCRESYYQFFLEFWPIIAAEKLNPAWYIKLLCDELQDISERVFRNEPKEGDMVWNCPPGTSKSSVVSILWQPWIWTRMPSARFISGCYAEKLALDHSRKSRDVVMSEKYKKLFPEVKLREDQNTKGYFATTDGGIRYAVGVGGSVLGMHAHFIAIDDPLDPQEALSDLEIATANTWMDETLSRRKVNLMLTPTVLIMQRLHQDDPSGHKLAKGGRVKHFCLPCDTSWEIKPERLRQYYQDDPAGGPNLLLDPDRLSQSALDDALEDLTEVPFAGQYGQSPIPRGGAMFLVDRLTQMYTAPTRWKRGPFRYWDKAGKKKKRSAWTVGVKGALDFQDRVWVLDVIRGQWDSGFREQKIVDTARLDGRECIQVVEQEPSSGGEESAEGTAKRVTLAGYRCIIDVPRGDKETRADPFSTQVNIGNVILLNGHWNAEYIKELRFFPRSKYKDQVDASGGLFAKLANARIKIGAMRDKPR